MIICAGCRQAKDETEFYRSNRRNCKVCVCAAVRLRALTNPAVQAYDRKRAKRPDRAALSTVVTKRWRDLHPEAYRAQNALNNAIRDGKIERGPCAVCATTVKVRGHHQDYSTPLIVVWLCARCQLRIIHAFPILRAHEAAAP